MLEFMTEGDGNILGIRATGKLSDEDYQHVLAPRVQSLLEQFHTLRVLFLMDETFQGWSLTAAWANTIFDLKHLPRLREDRNDRRTKMGGMVRENGRAAADARPDANFSP